MNKAQRYFVSFSIVATVASLALFVPWKWIGIAIMPLPSSIQGQLQRSLDAGLDGAILYVEQAEQPPTLLAAGWHNRGERQPARPDALFRIASITKLYVATVIVTLVHKGVLALEESLAYYLPEKSAHIQDADKITLRMLIQHRSGVPNFTDHPDYHWLSTPVSQAQKLALLANNPLMFPPGSDYQYSNSNFLLLGEIIQEVTQRSFEQHIKTQILQPLALQETFFGSEMIDDTRLMSGYHEEVTADMKTLQHLGPSGSMIASARDLGIFMRALNTGTLLNEREKDLYVSLYPLEHTGLVPGYSSIARYLSDIDTVLVLFVSNSGGDTWALTETTFQRIERILRAQHANR